ncbi:SCO1860 family LAETG-anchored protein [Streptomyces triticagri]|nr:SCO1860 family LAETG-anchored protein [Streptomyces triticagri]
MPARRLSAAGVATVLAAGPAALAGAVPAHATGGDEGRAGAVVLRTGLDVSLLDKSVQVPLRTSLNEVSAPHSAEKTALTARLDGVGAGKPFSVLRADVATAKATVEGGVAEGRTELARARVNVPGLPGVPLVELGQVSSKAVCKAGERPAAEAGLLGSVNVLGKKVTLSAGGPTRVEVPGIGEVRLELSKTHTTSRTAAAAALELEVSLNPLKLNVAEVDGTVTLAGATCETPSAQHREPVGRGEKPAGPRKQTAGKDAHDADDGEGVKPQSAREPDRADLADTGGSSSTPYVAGAGVVLLALGGGAVAVARRRRPH